MVKFPPGGRARGPGAEPAGQPLIAQLKQDREDSRAEVKEHVDQVISQFTTKISEAIISTNRHMGVTHCEILGIPASLVLNGVKFGTARRFVHFIEVWAKKNGIRCVVEKINANQCRAHRYQDMECNCISIQNHSTEGDKLILNVGHISSMMSNHEDYLRFCISFNWGDE